MKITLELKSSDQDRNYIERVKEADSIIFVHPVLCWIPSAILGGFVINIFRNGIAYHSEVQDNGDKKIIQDFQNKKVLILFNSGFPNTSNFIRKVLSLFELGIPRNDITNLYWK